MPNKNLMPLTLFWSLGIALSFFGCASGPRVVRLPMQREVPYAIEASEKNKCGDASVERGREKVPFCEGMRLGFGDKLIVGEKNRIAFVAPDGARCTATPGSIVEIEEPRADVQWVRIHQGAVRLEIAAPSPEMLKGNQDRFRWVVVSNFSTVGIRWGKYPIDFVYEVGKSKSQVFNFSTNSIEVAKDFSNLLLLSGWKVSYRQFLEADEGHLKVKMGFGLDDFWKYYENLKSLENNSRVELQFK